MPFATMALKTMEEDVAIFAARARQSDAEVSFKAMPFLKEFLFNVSPLAPCLVRYFAGEIGAANRLFWGWRTPMLWLQCTWGTFFILIIALHSRYSQSEGYVVNTTEVILVSLLYILRIMTIAAKYAYLSRAELAELDLKKLPAYRLLEKLILVGE